MSNSNSNYGGYDYTFCERLPEECPCLVCTLVQKDPYQLTCCGKMYCKSCLDQLIKQNTLCPNCRGNFIKGNKYFPDVNTERKIKHLRIRCENEKQGCTWSGYLKDMKESHIPKCSYELVQCTYKKFTEKMQICGCCETRVQRRNLEKHMTAECKWRLVLCVYCKRKGTFNFINGKHTKECLSIPVACTIDGCQEKVKRSLLKTHQEYCPHKIVSCKYAASVGCRKKIKKRDIEFHNKECMEEHLESAIEIVNYHCVRLNGISERTKVLEEEDAKIKTEHVQDYNHIHFRLNKVFESTEVLEKEDAKIRAEHMQYYRNIRVSLNEVLERIELLKVEDEKIKTEHTHNINIVIETLGDVLKEVKSMHTQHYNSISDSLDRVFERTEVLEKEVREIKTEHSQGDYIIHDRLDKHIQDYMFTRNLIIVFMLALLLLLLFITFRS